MLENLDQWEGWSYFEMVLEMIKNKTSLQDMVIRFIEEAGYSPCEADRSARTLGQIDPEIFEQIITHNMMHLGEPLPKILKQIQCPCLFVSSNYELGSLVHPEDLPLVEKSLQKGSMVHIKNAGHGIHIEAPEAFNKAIKKILSGID